MQHEENAKANNYYATDRSVSCVFILSNTELI
jgi:hypothetical protein